MQKKLKIFKIERVKTKQKFKDKVEDKKMGVYFLWGGIGVLVLFLLIGFLCGLVRGVKRSAVHLVFALISLVVAFFITKPVTSAILNITLPINGGADVTLGVYIADMIISLVSDAMGIDKASLSTAEGFIANLPMAVVAPILFILLSIATYFVLDIIYLIFARITFGSKKKDFQEHKPLRSLGGLVGMVEGFVFMFVLFAPLTALTGVYKDIVYVAQESAPQSVVVLEEEQKQPMEKLNVLLSKNIPSTINEIVVGVNDSFVGKITSVFGFNNILFDGLSNFTFQDEAISIRNDLLNLSDTYNNFVDIYNKIAIDGDFNVDLSLLKQNVNNFVDSGIFKTFISGTIKDIVVNVDLSSLNLPEFVVDVTTEVKSTFSSENFDVYEYLKHDINSIFTTVESVFESGLIESVNNLEEKDVFSILKVIGEKNAEVKTVAENVFSLNLVQDGFESFVKFGSQELAKALENDKNLEIGLNGNITDKTKMIDDTLEVVNEFLELNDIVNMSAILSGEDVMDTLSKVENIDTAMTKLGEVFDKLQHLELLVLTKENDEKVYVFDNLLKIYDIDFLSDEVYFNIDDESKTKLDTYSKFFNYIKTPAKEAQELGLLNFNAEGFKFDAVMDKILDKLKTNEKKDYLAKLLLPFKQLTALNMNGLFNQVIEQLDASVDVLSFASVGDDFGAWKENLIILGDVLDTLNTGSIKETENDEGKTFIQYIVSENYDADTMLKAMLETKVEGGENSVFAGLMDNVFSAKIFEKLTKQVFDSADVAIGEFTGVLPKTNISKLEQTKTQVIATIEQLLQITLYTEELSLENVGNILDILKVNAYNDLTDDGVQNGTLDGVFNNIFSNLIWYITNDERMIDPDNAADYEGKTPYAYAGVVRAYLSNRYNITEKEDYYTADISYADVMLHILEEISKLPNIPQN